METISKILSTSTTASINPDEDIFQKWKRETFAPRLLFFIEDHQKLELTSHSRRRSVLELTPEEFQEFSSLLKNWLSQNRENDAIWRKHTCDCFSPCLKQKDEICADKTCSCGSVLSRRKHMLYIQLEKLNRRHEAQRKIGLPKSSPSRRRRSSLARLGEAIKSIIMADESAALRGCLSPHPANSNSYKKAEKFEVPLSPGAFSPKTVYGKNSAVKKTEKKTRARHAERG
jgi:hypothetical protein